MFRNGIFLLFICSSQNQNRHISETRFHSPFLSVAVTRDGMRTAALGWAAEGALFRSLQILQGLKSYRHCCLDQMYCSYSAYVWAIILLPMFKARRSRG